MDNAHRRIAIIGGGISGACAANRLISLLDNTGDLEIVLFDQGGRGPGGRASHRRVRIAGERLIHRLFPRTVAVDKTLDFDAIIRCGYCFIIYMNSDDVNS